MTDSSEKPQNTATLRFFEADEIIPEPYFREVILKEFGIDIANLNRETKQQWMYLRSNLQYYTDIPDDDDAPFVFTINGMQTYVDQKEKNNNISQREQIKLEKIKRIIQHFKTIPLCPLDRPVEIRKTYIPEPTIVASLTTEEMEDIAASIKLWPSIEQNSAYKPQQQPTPSVRPSPKPSVQTQDKPIRNNVGIPKSIDKENKPSQTPENKTAENTAPKPAETHKINHRSSFTSSPQDYLYYTCQNGVILYHTFGGAKIIREEPIESDYAFSKRLKVRYLNRFSKITELYKKDPNAVLEKGIYEASFAQNEKMGDNFDRMPYGIIHKSYTGIGATTLELRAKRNSIIVVPTRILAATKHFIPEFKHTTLYVGSSLEFHDAAGNPQIVPSPTKQQIQEYLENKSIEHKKFLVVADSLERLIRIIGTPQVYEKYFLMVDEADILQSDSTYRDSLPAVVDYYLKFTPTNRCLVSATIEYFSHPQLQKEPKVRIRYPNPPHRNIEMLYTSGINAALCDKIEKLHAQHPNEKILIAYNSIQDILDTIQNLNEQIRPQCSILCSKTTENRDRIGTDYFEELSGDKLPSQIVFMTCAYFVGIDINEDFHLISVSNPRKPYTLLSPNKLNQIAGRCRSPHKLLSDTIIYYSLEKNQDYIYNIRRYQQQLQHKADKIVELYNAANYIAGEDKTLIELFDSVKSAIQHVAGEKTFSGILPLTRTTIEAQPEPHYFNIDALTEQKNLIFNLYWNRNQLPTYLTRNKHVVQNILPDQKESYKEYNEDNTRSEIYLAGIDKLCDILRATPINTNKDKITIRTQGREYPTFINQYLELYAYVPLENLLEHLKAFASKRDQREYNNYYRSIMFWCLPEQHKFKKLIFSTFETGKTYTPSEIQRQLNIIFRPYYTFASPKAAVGFLKNCVQTSQDRHDGYKITGYYPTCKDMEPLQFLPVTENNLMKIFKL